MNVPKRAKNVLMYAPFAQMIASNVQLTVKIVAQNVNRAVRNAKLVPLHVKIVWKNVENAQKCALSVLKYVAN